LLHSNNSFMLKSEVKLVFHVYFSHIIFKICNNIAMQWQCIWISLYYYYYYYHQQFCQYSVWLRTGRPGDRAIGVRSPAGAKDFSSNLCVLTGSGALPASCTTGPGGSFPRSKARPGRDADHSPHLVPRSRMSRSYTSSPPSATMACSGTALLLLLLLLLF
jgi:hypothetical protein